MTTYVNIMAMVRNSILNDMVFAMIGMDMNENLDEK